MLAKSKLNSIDTLISHALIDMDISHGEFITILIEKDRYEMMKDDLRNKNGESYEIMRFNSVKSKIQKKIFFWCIYKREILLSICVNIKIFFSCVYIKESYYLVFCINKKIYIFLSII